MSNKNLQPELSAPIQPVDPDSLVRDIDAIYNLVSSMFKGSKQGLLSIVGYVQLQLMGTQNSKSSEIGQEIINNMQPIADAIDELNSLYPILRLVKANALAMRDESVNLSDTLEAVQSQFAMQHVRVPRPDCVLLEGDVPKVFQGLPAPSFDTFTAVNSEASVMSRIRFILGSNGQAVGVAVIVSEEDVHGPQTKNLFEFDRFISFAGRNIGRELDINNNTGDRFYLYRTVVDLAVKLADAEVSLAGPLVTILAEGGQATDEHTSEDDTLSAALQQLDEGVDSQVPPEDLQELTDPETLQESQPEATGQGLGEEEAGEGVPDQETDVDEPVPVAGTVALDNMSAADDMRDIEDLFASDLPEPTLGAGSAPVDNPDSEEIELTDADEPVQLFDPDDPNALLVDGAPTFEIDPDIAGDGLEGPEGYQAGDLLDDRVDAAGAALFTASGAGEVGERVSLDGGDPDVEDLARGQGNPFNRFED